MDVEPGRLEKRRERDGGFQMWCYRRMMKIKWVDRITNEEVLERTGERKTLWKSEEKKSSDDGAHKQNQKKLV